MVPHGGMQVNRSLLPILAFTLALACEAGCASPKAVRLDEAFLKRGHPAIGVALAKGGSPGIRDRYGGYEHLWPFISRGSEYDQLDVYSEKGGASEPEPEPGGVQPPQRGELLTLRSRMDAASRDALKEAVKSFAQGIMRPGWRVVPLSLAIDKVDPEAPYLKGLDALIILDYSWYGVQCHDEGLAGDLADSGADLTGRMTELTTGRLLWQSPKLEIRNPVWCRCSDPACYDDIGRGVRGAVFDAQEAAVKDFFSQTP
jgi:hypothetical protein